MTEVNELDVPADPCNSDQSYNFHACVKTSIAKQVKESCMPKSLFLGRWDAALGGTPAVGKISLIAQQEINTGDIFIKK